MAAARVILLLALLLSATGVSGAVLDMKKDFGARGDGRTDDTRAFMAAAAQVNKLRTNVTLIIPAGTYSIRPQTALNLPANAMPAALPVLDFEGCTNLTIRGSAGTKIKFAAGMHYGAFWIDAGHHFKPVDRKTTDWQFRVALGHGIKLKDCRQVQISGLDMDGNCGSLLLGAEFGDTGYQIDNDGVFVQDVTDLTISNSAFHHFGRDGILILNKTPQGFTTPSQHIKLVSCRFDYNGRQAITWSGGAGLSATGCSFSYTATQKISSAPRAGVDFEPNSGYVVHDGTFINCSFIKNAGLGIITDEGGPYSRDIKFIGCNVESGGAAAIWIKGAIFRFVDCDIRGGFLFGCAADNATNGTRFTGCHFSDAGTEQSNYNFLVESNGSKYLVFDGCDFKVVSKALIYIAPASAAEQEKPVFNNCTFQTDYRTDEAARKAASLYSNNTRFTGTTTFRSNTERGVMWNLATSGFESWNGTRSNVVVGHGFLLQTYEGIHVGDGHTAASATIENGGTMVINQNAGLSIGTGSNLTVKKGGVLRVAAGATLNVKGSIVAETGAGMTIDPGAHIDDGSRKNIRFNAETTTPTHPASGKKTGR